MQQSKKNRILKQVDSLPSLPATVSMVMAVTADPESCGNDLVKAILPDQAMCATILKIANSAFFGIPREVATIEKAVNVLGFNEVHNIVLGKAVFNSFQTINDTNRHTVGEFWQHSFHCGLAAKIIAEELRCPPSELFIAGLIHDIGKLAFFTSQPVDYRRILEMKQNGSHFYSREEELRQFGIDHGEVGLHLLTCWMFPEQLLNTVGYHHRPEECSEYALHTLIVQLSDILSVLATDDTDEDENDSLYTQITTLLPGAEALWQQHTLNIDEEQLQQWRQALLESIEKDSAILNIFTSS